MINKNMNYFYKYKKYKYKYKNKLALNKNLNKSNITSSLSNKINYKYINLNGGNNDACYYDYDNKTNEDILICNYINKCEKINLKYKISKSDLNSKFKKEYFACKNSNDNNNNNYNNNNYNCKYIDLSKDSFHFSNFIRKCKLHINNLLNEKIKIKLEILTYAHKNGKMSDNLINKFNKIYNKKFISNNVGINFSFNKIIEELKKNKMKVGCWIWYIFPSPE
jgi:hypothetical protein